LAEATESPMRKRRTFIPISSVLDVDASLNAFQGFSMPYGASLTIMVNIIQRNGHGKVPYNVFESVLSKPIYDCGAWSSH